MKTVKWNSLKPLKKLLVSPNGATAGRNSSGRITSFHRGGGAKRLHRVVDLKRNTASMGVVERIEYDPNRSARLALVRWIEGVQPKIPRGGGKKFSAIPKTKNPSTVKANVAGQFPLACLASGVWAANPLHKEGNKLSSVRDVFLAAFGSKKANNVSLSKLPRIAVGGARPIVFVTQGVEQVVEGKNTLSLSDVQKWDKDSAHWENSLKPKAAVHWSSRFVRKGPVGLAQAAHNRVTNSGGKSSKKRTDMADRVALSYIIATEGMEPGSMVMNCAAPESSE